MKKRHYFVSYVLKNTGMSGPDFRSGVFEIEPPPREHFWKWEEKIRELANLAVGKVTVVSFQEI